MSALALLALPMVAAASAQELPPPPIVNGETTNAWPGVGVLVIVEPSGQKTAFCSGTLVASDLVVTAAHCVDAAELYRDYGLDIHFGFGASVDDLDRSVEVDEMDTHPDYFYDNSGIGADVATLTLVSPVSGVQPLPIYTDTFDTSFLSGDVTLVGYGITGDGRDDAGTKRTATLPLQQADGDFVYAVDDDPEGSNACSGDSGGAALVKVGGDWALAGVLSFVFPYYDASHYCIGGGVGAVRMDVYGDWVLDGAEGGTGTGGSTDGGGDDDDGGGGTTAASAIFGDEGGCSVAPAGGGLLGFGMLLFGLRRRAVRVQNSRV